MRRVRRSPSLRGAVARLGLGRLNEVAFSPDGHCLVIGTSLGVELRDAGTLELVRFLHGHTKWVRPVAFSSDSRLLASGYGDMTVKLWDVATGREIRTLSHGGEGWGVYTVAFSPDGRLLASGGHFLDDRGIKLWEVATGEEVRILSGHTNWVYSVAFSPDGTLLASGSTDGTVLLWPLKDYRARLPQACPRKRGKHEHDQLS